MLEMESSDNTWETSMRKFFRWVFETYSCRMFQWKYGLSSKQLNEVEERVKRYEYRIKTNYGGELVINIPNIML